MIKSIFDLAVAFSAQSASRQLGCFSDFRLYMASLMPMHN